MNRILVIRGGAIGDFILTLPALKALRDAWPQAHIEILGYRHIAALAEKRFYVQAVHSIEYGPLGRFFARNSELPAELSDRFASFEDLVVISGEADEAQTNKLETEWKNRDVRFARNLPLPVLAAVLEHPLFIGHDSGISHLAAAAGAKSILLFGPTDPDVWAP